MKISTEKRRSNLKQQKLYELRGIIEPPVLITGTGHDRDKPLNETKVWSQSLPSPEVKISNGTKIEGTECGTNVGHRSGTLYVHQELSKCMPSLSEDDVRKPRAGTTRVKAENRKYKLNKNNFNFPEPYESSLKTSNTHVIHTYDHEMTSSPQPCINHNAN